MQKLTHTFMAHEMNKNKKMERRQVRLLGLVNYHSMSYKNPFIICICLVYRSRI